MSVQLEWKDAVLVAYLSGELDHHTARPIRQEIDDAASQSPPELLVLDFGGVSFMDSSGIGLVMGRYRLMEELGGQIILQNLPAPIKKVMRVAGMDKLAAFR